MYSNQTPYTPGAPYVPPHGLPTPPSGQQGYRPQGNSAPGAPYMGPVPLPRTPYGGYSQLPSPPESPTASRHALPSLGEYITPTRISYDVRYSPSTVLHANHLGQIAADRSITIHMPALGNAMGVGYITVSPARGYPVTVQNVLDCLYQHLNAQPSPLLSTQQRAAIEAHRLRERGSSSPPLMRDLLQGNTIFQGLFVQNNTIVAHFSR